MPLLKTISSEKRKQFKEAGLTDNDINRLMGLQIDFRPMKSDPNKTVMVVGIAGRPPVSKSIDYWEDLTSSPEVFEQIRKAALEAKKKQTTIKVKESKVSKTAKEIAAEAIG